MAGPRTGLRGAFQQPSRWGRNETGNWTEWNFEGTREEVDLLASTYAQTLGLAYQVTESFGKHRLDIHLPWSMNGIDPRTDRVDNWEFFAQHSEKYLLNAQVENPGTVGNLSVIQKDAIRFWLDNPPDPKTDEPVGIEDVNPKNQPNGAIALAIYQLMAKGNTNFPVEVPTLRHTLITSNQYAAAASLFGVRRIVSTATVTSTENIPSALLFTLPFDVSADADFVYGWLKFFPTIQQIALLKWQIVQEYQYGLWPTLTWGTPL